jgi:metal-responsive CopG/Arc/MetJ family transcriptional regulator
MIAGMKSRMKAGGGGTRRVTVSLPADLFERGEDERNKLHEGRSQFVAGLYRRYLQEVDERQRAARYAAAYGKLPETPEERWLVQQSLDALADAEE